MSRNSTQSPKKGEADKVQISFHRHSGQDYITRLKCRFYLGKDEDKVEATRTVKRYGGAFDKGVDPRRDIRRNLNEPGPTLQFVCNRFLEQREHGKEAREPGEQRFRNLGSLSQVETESVHVA